MKFFDLRVCAAISIAFTVEVSIIPPLILVVLESMLLFIASIIESILTFSALILILSETILIKSGVSLNPDSLVPVTINEILSAF